MRLLNNLQRDEAGATSIEYALIAGLVAIAIVSSITTLGNNLGATWNTVAAAMSATTP
jgi:pilus assembly protein Flp/PilA